MAKVSLRIYNREIESLIDQGLINEAIAHCHHILQTFPKHLATYRLLGKAHLELKHFAEAVDVFGRVLMAVPDDFVSHVGMSIVCDEQNKLDDAIWHMQRAFESQPSNAAIQGELQRLYGRRDGMEPPKVRMTRGALAHMYVQGELYPQAIAEVRAVLQEDAERADMQVLLAHAYFHSGQKAEASDICAQLLKRYEYCLDANRIMVDLLPAPASAAESSVYRLRVEELDPYTAYAKGSIFSSSEIADNTISLEKLEYKGGEEKDLQNWSPSLGLDSGVSAAAASQVVELNNNEIPDFLREAGWGEAKSAEQPVSLFDEESGDSLTPADIPDWLKDQAPVSDASSTKPEPQTETGQSLDIPEWLLDQTSDAAQTDNIPDWLKDTPSQPASESAPADIAPIMLGSLDDNQPAEPAQPAEEEFIPDWLGKLDETPAVEFAQESNTPDSLSRLDDKQPVEPVQEGNVPDWLSGLDEKKAVEPAQESNIEDWLSKLDETSAVELEQESNVPAWLGGLDGKYTEEPVQESSIDDWLSKLDELPAIEPAQESSLPDWLGGLDVKKTVEPVQENSVEDWLSKLDETPAVEPTQESTLPDWLGGLDDKKAAEPVQESSVEDWLTKMDDTEAVEPAQAADNLPDWLSGLESKDEEPAAISASVDSLGTTAQEQDDAVAWLESLAAKHGAKPEEMVTDPDKRSETPPEWVSKAQNPDQVAPAASVESLGSTAQEQDDAVAWLESLAAKHGAKPEEMVTDPNKRSETPPDWVSQAQSIGEAKSTPAGQAEKQEPETVDYPQIIDEQFVADFENAARTAPATDETSAWFRNLKNEEKPEQPLSTSQNIPEWLREPESEPEKPEWLADAQPETSSSFDQLELEKPELDEHKSDMPGWLSAAEKDAVPQETAAYQETTEPESDLAQWLNSLDDEPGLPFDNLPTTPDSLLFSAQSSRVEKKTKETEPAAERSDLPEWITNVEQPTVEPVEAVAEESVSTEELPIWQQEGFEEGTNEMDEDDDTPPWQRREQWEAEEPQQPQPTSPSDWHPLEPAPVESKPVTAPKQAAPIETPLPFMPPPSQPPVQSAAEQTPPPAVQPAQKKKISLAARKLQPDGSNTILALNQAKSELDRGDIPAALSHYSKLIKKGKHIEETIRDLAESIYRYPVEVGIWQTLGDAYMRANRLKEALEAYNKAEELIR